MPSSLPSELIFLHLCPCSSISHRGWAFSVSVPSLWTRGWKSETLIHWDLCTETSHAGTINYPLKPLSVCILLFQALIEATQRNRRSASARVWLIN